MAELCWTPRAQETVSRTVARLINDASVRDLAKSPEECHNQQEFLQRFNQSVHPVEEFKVLQRVTVDNCNDLEDGLEVIVPWLVYDILPRLQAPHVRSQALETTVDLLSSKFSAFIKDVSIALPEAHGMPSITTNQARLSRLSTALQKQKEEFDCNDNNHASQSTKEPEEAFEDSNEDDRYTVLMERIEALEKTVHENRENMKAHQPFVMVEESAETARNQIMQEAAQERPSEFAALSDASTSSTCTLTPASTVVNEPVGGNCNTGRDRVSTATTLDLRVFIHVDEIATVSSNGIDYYDTPYPLVVRMYRNAPFKSLTDKLFENFGNQELRRKNAPLKCIFDSDTPASLNLEQNDELIFAILSDRVKTMDLTMQ